MDLLSDSKEAFSISCLIQNIKKIVDDSYELHVSLADLSNWKVGGLAAVVVRPTDEQQIISLIKMLKSNNIDFIIIGDTTNLLFDDRGLNIVVVQISKNFSKMKADNNIIAAQAGAWTPYIARLSKQKSLTGLEHTVGIPGTIGGLIFMNGGSLRKSIGTSILSVKTLETNGLIKRWSKEDCQFSYRESIFKKRNSIILSCKIMLNHGNINEIRSNMLSILSSRRKKFPRKQPNCGSVFVSNPNMYETIGPPGKAIEDCGLKGVSRGGALISTLHANFIVNQGGATASDILYLIKKTRNAVYENTGFHMESEVRFVHYNGHITNAHKVEY